MRLDDNSLTETGLASPKTADVSGRVMLLACGALAREILAMTRLNGWTHLDLACLPAKLHNVPQKIPEAVRAKVREARARGYSTIYVVYADCGTGGLLDKVCIEEGVERIAGPHCYSFFDGNEAFAERAEAGEITKSRNVDGLKEAWKRTSSRAIDRRETRKFAERFSWTDTIRKLSGLMHHSVMGNNRKTKHRIT